MHESSFGRLIGVLVAPQRTFEALAVRPTWAVALVVVLFVLAGLGYVVNINTDHREMVEQALERRGGGFEPEQVERMVELQENFGAVFAVVGALFAGMVFAITALVFWVAAKLLGSDLTYRQSLATYLHGIVPVVVGILLAIVVVAGRGDVSLEQIATQSYLASNLAAFAPEDTGMGVKAALAGIDFFGLWSLVLLVIGYRVVARISTAAAAALAVTLWLLGIGLRVFFAMLNSGGFS